MVNGQTTQQNHAFVGKMTCRLLVQWGHALVLIYWVVHTLQIPLQQGVSNEFQGQTVQIHNESV